MKISDVFTLKNNIMNSLEKQDYSDFIDDELPVPPIDWKARQKYAWGCMIFLVIFWGIVIYLIIN